MKRFDQPVEDSEDRAHEPLDVRLARLNAQGTGSHSSRVLHRDAKEAMAREAAAQIQPAGQK